MTSTPALRIGTAGGNIPGEAKSAFSQMPSQLESYARVFGGVEINSSFYRSHRISTYERWAAAVPDDFRFAVKMPKTITHQRKLVDAELLADQFVAEVAGLGTKLGPLLIQLPPSLAFNPSTAEPFFRHLRSRVVGPIACEPRHGSWFNADVDEILNAFQIGRVVADPSPTPQAKHPGGWRGLQYLRLHGSPRIYYSDYSDAQIDDALAPLSVAAEDGSECWCIFDNTASGAATLNALTAIARCDTVQENSACWTGSSQ